MTLRKHVGRQPAQQETEWLPLEQTAEVEVTSEDPEAPIEGALMEGRAGGWRAADPGPQTLRIRFDAPRDLALVHLTFEETERERVQELALEWSADRGETVRPILRQQFTFSPSGATREIENYRINVRGITDLYLHINPSISGGPHVATLSRLRLR